MSGRFTASPAGLLVGPTGQWIDRLTTLALEYGISTFILGGDDPAAIQTFGLGVAPAVRDRVAAERARAIPDSVT